jgi:hypothetical protein
MSSTTTCNPALTDEIEAIRAIFDEDTIQVVPSDSSTTTLHLKPPAQPFTFTLSFPPTYPDVPPSIDGTASTGDTSKGAGDHAVKLLAEILGTVYQPGAVCLFELISDAGPLLKEESNINSDGNNGTHTTTPPASSKEDPEQPNRSAQPTSPSPSPYPTSNHEPPTTTTTLTPSPSDPTTTYPPPQWTTSTPLTLQKSTFLAHAAPCTSRSQALSQITSLISSSKKLATATHNITAYRIRLRQPTSPPSSPPTYIQDSNDDGESAAGSRLLHLLQVMGCEDVVVVVTRWYGGVKLGGERFRCIGNVAREVLVKGGWGKGTEKQKDGSTTRGKKK